MFRILHVEIPVLDLDRAMAFYQAVFDLSFDRIERIHDNDMAFITFAEGLDGASAALCCGEVYRPTLDGAILYVAVDDLDATLGRALAAGSEILFEKTPVGTGFVAEIRDSEGNRLALQSF